MYTPINNAWIRLSLQTLITADLHKSSVILLAVLIDQTRAGNHYEPVTISIAELMQLTGYSRRQMYRALDELCKLDLIQRRSTGRGLVITLTGAVKVLPPIDGRDTKAKQIRAAKERKAAEAAKEIQHRKEMDQYLQFVNRFKADYTEPQPEPDPEPPKPREPQKCSPEVEAWLARGCKHEWED